MNNSERQAFDAVIEKFQEQYPHRHIGITNENYGEIVNIDYRPAFNLTGYNLLFNLKRLCDCLDGELL